MKKASIYYLIATSILVGALLIRSPTAHAQSSDAEPASSAATTAISSSNSKNAAANLAPSAEPDTVSAMTLGWLPTFTIGMVATLFVGGVLITISALKRDPAWTLAKTLSEEADLPPPAAGAAVQGNANTPQPTLVGSTSRLIGFLGLIGLLAMFMGLGFYVLWGLFNGATGQVKSALTAIQPYLLYGTALFAPYAFNQIKSAFSA